MGKNRFPRFGRRNRFELVSAGVRMEELKTVRDDLSRAQGLQLVKEGKALCIRSDAGMLLGFQLIRSRNLANEPAPKSHRTVSSGLPVVVITRAEVEANAGLHGGSQTAGMSDKARAKRALKGWETEDFIERACQKVAAWGELRLC